MYMVWQCRYAGTLNAHHENPLEILLEIQKKEYRLVSFRRADMAASATRIPNVRPPARLRRPVACSTPQSLLESMQDINMEATIDLQNAALCISILMECGELLKNAPYLKVVLGILLHILKTKDVRFLASSRLYVRAAGLIQEIHVCREEWERVLKTIAEIHTELSVKKCCL